MQRSVNTYINSISTVGINRPASYVGTSTGSNGYREYPAIDSENDRQFETSSIWKFRGFKKLISKIFIFHIQNLSEKSPSSFLIPQTENKEPFKNNIRKEI